MDHTVCHFEIPAEKSKRAAEFYRGLFDWKVREWDSAVKVAASRMRHGVRRSDPSGSAVADQADSLWRPLRRRALMTAWPARVDMR